MLLVPTLLGAVTLGDALAGEVTNVGLDRTVVFAFAFIRHAHVSASGLTLIAKGSPVDTAHRSIDFRAAAPFADALVLRASQDAFLANPAHGAIGILVAHAFPGRLLAVALVANAHAGAGCFASVDVVAAVTAANRLENPRAIAARRTGNTPRRIRTRRDARCVRALISDEAIVGRPTMHRLVATTAVLDVMLAAGSIFERIGLAVLAANESLDRTDGVATGLTTSSNRHRDGANDHTSQPESIHHNSPRTGVHTVCIGNFDASARGGKPP
jgi:hypothetical protein